MMIALLQRSLTIEAWGNVNDCLVATNSYTERGVLMPLLNGLMSVNGLIPVGEKWRLIVLHLKINLTSTIDQLKWVSYLTNVVNFLPVVNQVALVMLPLHAAMEYLEKMDIAHRPVPI